jgi:glucosamine--fructose-6-phosphate aminotransferase (isomerizing)
MVWTRDGGILVHDHGGLAAAPRMPRRRGSVVVRDQLLMARGRSDGRTLLLVPEVQAGQSTGLTLLHVEFHEPSFDEARLAEISVEELLATPVHRLADRY